MKRLVLAVAVVAFAACAKAEEAPVADSPAAAAAPTAISADSTAVAADTTMKTDSAKKDTTKK